MTQSRSSYSWPRVILSIQSPKLTTQSYFHPLGLQSHYFLSWVFRIIGLQISSLAFKATIFFHRHSEPSFPVLSFESHSFHQFQAFRATHLFQFQASRATISSQFGIQSHHHMSSVWRSEPCLQFGIQSHCPLQFGISSSCAYSFRYLESPSFFILAFKVIFPQSYHLESQLLVFIFTGIPNLALMILHSSLFSLPRYLVLIACSSCSSRASHPPQHMTQSFELIACVLILSLVSLTPCPCIVYVCFFHLYSFLCYLVV